MSNADGISDVNQSFWEKFITTPDQPEDLDYGYIKSSNPYEIVECKDEFQLKDQIILYFRSILFIAIPGQKKFDLFGTKYFHHEWTLPQKLKLIQASFRWPILITIAFVGLLFWLYQTNENAFQYSRVLRLYWVAFGLIPMLSYWNEWRKLTRINKGNYEKEAEFHRFRYWVSNRNINAHYYIPALLALAYFFQVFYGYEDMIKLFGLEQQAIVSGEYFRLITCVFLHGGIVHLFFNGLAIYYFGYLVLAFFRFHQLVAVFLISGLLGSLFSFWLPPDAISIGASGGALGIIGFLIAISLRFKHIIPIVFSRELIAIIAYTAVIGVLGFDFIDNAAHGGGVLMGFLLGWIPSENAIVDQIKQKSMIKT